MFPAVAGTSDHHGYCPRVTICVSSVDINNYFLFKSGAVEKSFRLLRSGKNLEIPVCNDVLLSFGGGDHAGALLIISSTCQLPSGGCVQSERNDDDIGQIMKRAVRLQWFIRRQFIAL